MTTDRERERHRLAILDAAIPDWRARAERYDPYPIALRFIDVDDTVLVRAQVPNHADREPLLRAIHVELGTATPVRFTP